MAAAGLATLGLVAPGCPAPGTDDDPVEDPTGGGTTGDEPSTSADDADSGAADETSAGSTGEDPGPWESLDERPCPVDSFLTFENFGGPFMLSYCTGCHQSMLPADMRQGAPIEVDFDGIEDIRAQAERIWARSADQNSSMPPVGPPGDEERALLGEWLACGAPLDADGR